MRELDTALICQTVADMVVQANCCIGADVMESLRQGRDREEKPLARSILDKLIRNDEIAARRAMPLCQDTGMAVFRVRLGQELHIVGQPLEEALQQGMAQGYREGYLRKSVVRDPVFHRENTGENMSTIKMLKPADGEKGVREFILSAVEKAGPNPCPPIIVGVGIGGTFDKCAQLSKFALMRPVGSQHPDPAYAAMERELLDEINRMDIGPAGLGGRTTALAVHIETYPTHIAGLPVAVNLCCHAYRHAHAVL